MMSRLGQRSLTVRSGFVSACVAIAIVVTACSATTRYQVLSTLFDGVPPPGGTPTPVDDSTATSAVEGPGSLLPAPSEPTLFVHPPYRDRRCTECHDLDRGTQMMIAPDGLCLKCHEKLVADAPYVHGPVAAGACLLCHVPHTSPRRYLLVDEPATLCSRCHETDALITDVHRPKDGSALGVCVECHNPHSGDNGYFLRSPREDG